MRKPFVRILAALLIVLMLFQLSGESIAYAADALDKALNPEKQIELIVPQSLQDGENYFFIREDTFTISEKSSEKLYIPIQRTGDIDAATDVTLKVIDMSAHFGVNYEARICDEKTAPVAILNGIAVIDLFLYADEQIEAEPIDEDELGTILTENGGSGDILAPDGEVVGSISAVPLDENGNPISPETDGTASAAPAAEPGDEGESVPDASAEAEAEETALAEDGEPEEEPLSPPRSLMAARNAFTGTQSDRQQLAGGDTFGALSPAQRLEAAQEGQQRTDAEIAAENYPGREYALHFEAGEVVKFLEITPKYSEAADGDSTIILMLKDLPENAVVPEDFNMRSVVITDEDAHEEVVISLTQETIRAEDGKAAITVTRTGRINDLVGVMLSSQDGSAAAGDDYGGVGAKLWFSMGITSRTVELPVGHGAEEKDFTVTIAPLPAMSDVKIGLASARVIIPAGEKADDGELMASTDLYGDMWNLRDRTRKITGKVNYDSDTAVSYRTSLDKCETQYISLYTDRDYAWDGIHVVYDYHTWYSKGKVDVELNNGDGNWVRVFRKDWGDLDEKWKREQIADAYFGQLEGPWIISIDNYTYEVHNGFRDSHSDIVVTSVQPIKRQFTIKMLAPEALSFEGMTEAEVLARYEQVMLDSGLDTSVTLYTGDNFSISRLSSPEMARLVGIEAVRSDGMTYRIANITGSNGTATVELNPRLINLLAGYGYIEWKESKGSYTGTIQVRPVFDYVKSVTVQIRDTAYGTPCLEDEPPLRWEFDSDQMINVCMGANSRHNVDWQGETDNAGNDYYTFTATGDDPYVSIDMPYANASKLVWVKVRARNLCGADAIELFGKFNDTGPEGTSCVHIDLEQDKEWHTYLVNIPESNIQTVNAYKGATISTTTWKGKANWLRLDPVWNENSSARSGDQIQIDYVAFFSDKEKAESYHNGTAAGTTLTAGRHTFHYGDKLVFLPNLDPAWAGRMRALGISSESRRNGPAGTLNGKNDGYYVGEDGADQWSVTLDQDYYEFWQFYTDIDNLVEVQIPISDAEYFDTEKGLFAGLTPTVSGNYQIWTVRESVLTNELVDLIALPKDESHVPIWNLAGNGNSYSGSEFFFFAGVQASDNLVTLRMDRTASDHAWYSLRGTACYSTLNLESGNEADDLYPAEFARITSAMSGAESDRNGDFTLEPMYLRGESMVRYIVHFNGTSMIREVKVAPANAATETVNHLDTAGGYSQIRAIPVDLGNVKVEGWSRTGAHFSNVSVTLANFNPDVITAMEMNGKTLTVKITVDPGQPYIWEGAQCRETVTEVTLWFQSQLTGEIHGIYSTTLQEGETSPGLTWNQMTNTATLTIRKFSPDAPEKYTYGDVMMLQLTTDKKTSAGGSGLMVYQPVSSGYTVITDQNYVPETYEEDVDMSSMLDAALSEENKTRYSFGQFPWLGNITGVFATFSYFVSSGFNNTAQMILDDLQLMEDGDAELMAGVLPRKAAISAAVAFKELPYGGVRTMIAVAVSFGNAAYSRRANPYQAREVASTFLSGITSGSSGDLLYGGGQFNGGESLVQSELGGSYIYFTIYVGLYLDWGFIEKAVTDSDGETEQSHFALFLGAGGFYGISMTGGYTKYVFPWGVPVYFNIEANIDLTVFLGSSADPQKTLESFYETSDHKGQDFAFNMEIYADAGLKLTIGVGLYKIIGVRASGGVGVQAGLSLRMADWFPDLEGADTLSVSTDATFSGSVDLIVTSIDLWSASWPLPLGYGWLQYFQQMRRANILIHFINEEINEHRGSQAARDECRRLADELGAYVDAYQGTGKALKKLVDNLNDYAYDHGIIRPEHWARVNMIRQGGLLGNMAESYYAWMMEDDGQSSLFHTRDHVDTRWVAGEDASLMAAFGPVSTAKLVENAVSQPAAQIAALGNNRFLAVFLDDDASRDRQQAGVLKWAVYDANTNAWTAPQTVQDDGTADGRPNLIDGGDKLILSWSSIPQEKYAAMKLEVARELNVADYNEETEVYTITDDTAVLRTLETNPDRVMSAMDIFTAEFSKTGLAFGPITQLTDDDFYDDGPQAVYDSETGDYVILYYKTAQDTEAYAGAEDRLLDMVNSNADPNRTYGVMCYMLYNNQTETPDTNGLTHASGWARDYLFPNETDLTPAAQAAFLAVWGGQRFLASAIKSVGPDGRVIQSDAPIADLTVCSGYNGLAAYAFTVDMDYNVDTAEDKELFVQFYRFADHKTYVPVKVAGEAVKEKLNSAVRDANRRTIVPATVTEAVTPVNVGQPKLIRNEGSTWLFWREDERGLRYLNISELLNKKLETGPGDDDWVYALQDNGTFATDPDTGKPYEPEAQWVDFGSAMTDGKMTITDYQVITDRDDNLYVVWTDLHSYEVQDDILETTISNPAQAIYASAKIKQTNSDVKEGEVDSIARWSKPYRLTKDDSSNDGVTVALDDDGGLILLHNQFFMELADTEAEIAYMLANHLAGTYHDEESGNDYFLGYPYYPSGMSLMVTRCEPIGSVEATTFVFDDVTPVAGQTVQVAAAVENVGLTNAKGCEVRFYEYRNGVQGRLLQTAYSEEEFQVNSARQVVFDWTIPADGPEGFCIQAVAREKRADGTWYDPTETFSEPFVPKAEYAPELVKCVQSGDGFDVEYTVTNTGNLAAPQGMKADLVLEGLYGDLKEQYGMDDDLLITEDISGLAPGETRTVAKTIVLPVTVFRFCGYDAVTVVVRDQYDEAVKCTDHSFITLDAPLNLELNGGAELALMSGEKKTAALRFDSTGFMDISGKTKYSVSDPAVASVDENGVVTGISEGTATLTATLMPSGRTVEIRVTVSGTAEPGSSDVPTIREYMIGLSGRLENGTVQTGANSAIPGSRVTFTPKPEEGYTVGTVTVTNRNGIPLELIDNGDGTWSFIMPAENVRIGVEFVPAGAPAEEPPAPDQQFADVPAGTWFTDAVAWAVAQGITNGTDETHFSPDVPCTRAQMVTFLWRAAGKPEPAGGEMPFQDVAKGSYYEKAVLWAVEQGITQGVSETEFAPDATVTRAQTVTFLYRFAGAHTKAAAVFADVPVDSWYAEAVTWAVENKITRGTGDTTFSPDDACVRAQIVTFLYRYPGEE